MPGDLLNVPVKITTLAEYEKYFGSRSRPSVGNQSLDEMNNIVFIEVNTVFYMYGSINLFFENGGGECYIVSVDLFDAEGLNPGASHFTGTGNGLDAIGRVDQVPLLFHPDISLPRTGKRLLRLLSCNVPLLRIVSPSSISPAKTRMALISVRKPE
jgi:uncharacterized protein